MDKFELKLWNGFYYLRGRFPDGVTFTLKSADDLTYAQWKVKAIAAWQEHQKPEPEPDECQCPNCNQPFVCENR